MPSARAAGRSQPSTRPISIAPARRAARAASRRHITTSPMPMFQCPTDRPRAPSELRETRKIVGFPTSCDRSPRRAPAGAARGSCPPNRQPVRCRSSGCSSTSEARNGRDSCVRHEQRVAERAPPSSGCGVIAPRAHLALRARDARRDRARERVSVGVKGRSTAGRCTRLLRARCRDEGRPPARPCRRGIRKVVRAGATCPASPPSRRQERAAVGRARVAIAPTTRPNTAGSMRDVEK